MIAVALSGGVDSAAAAIRLHTAGEALIGLTLSFGRDNPPRRQIEHARQLCRHLGIPHTLVEAAAALGAIQRSFCADYQSGITPNPCALCNRDIKFELLRQQAHVQGADYLATGHYVRPGYASGRHFLSRSRGGGSQEYFLGLVSQVALAESIFPLADITREAAVSLLEGCGLDIDEGRASQDVCFIPGGDYVRFIQAHSGYRATPGPILDIDGHIIGTHRGVIHYTIGQRKGLGMGFGRRVYVLAIDVDAGTVTVGDPSHWPHRGFFLDEVNYMKCAGISEPVSALVKVRYRQQASPALITPAEQGKLWVAYEGLWAPGQLAVVYDAQDAILLAGRIRPPTA